MARQLICDVCDVTYTDSRHDHQTVELNGKSLKVYLDIDNGEHPGFSRLDICPACRNQVLGKIIEQGEE